MSRLSNSLRAGAVFLSLALAAAVFPKTAVADSTDDFPIPRRQIATELSQIPMSQLRAQKLIVNQAYENMGLAGTQTLGPILDGLMRNTPEALEFIGIAERQGVSAVTTLRDTPFGDYSTAPKEEQPNPNNVIIP